MGSSPGLSAVLSAGCGPAALMASSWSARKITVVERPPVWRGDAVVNVVVTGGAGFLGARLARRLLAAGELDLAGGGGSRSTGSPSSTRSRRRPTWPRTTGWQRSRATSASCWRPGRVRDRAGPDRRAGPAGRVRPDLPPGGGGQRGVRGRLRPGPAGQPAGHRGAAGRGPRAGHRQGMVFSSSLAVFGNPPDHPLPVVVDDQTLASPQSSYRTRS